MRTLLMVMAALVLVTGCSTAIEGRAVAVSRSGSTENGRQSGLPLSDDAAGVVLGTAQDGGAAAIDLFVEPQCPHCGDFVARYGDQIKEYLSKNRLSVTVRPLTFLDSASDDYSARATNAIFLLAASPSATPVQVWTFIQGLYAKVMATRMTLDDDAIAQVANDAGADPNTVNTVAAGEPAVDPDQVSDDNSAKMTGYGVAAATPTVYDLVHKEDVDISGSHWLDDLVR